MGKVVPKLNHRGGKENLYKSMLWFSIACRSFSYLKSGCSYLHCFKFINGMRVPHG